MVTRVLEGKYRWGYLDEAPLGRGVWVRQRLTVYPPGTNCAERRLLTFHRDWPLIGAITALLAMIVLGAITRPLVGAGVAAVLYLGGLVVASHVTAVLRGRCLTVVVVSIAVNGSLEVHGNAPLMDWSRDILQRLAVTEARGLLTPLQYESIWARVYNTIDEETRQATTPPVE
jgi:hypothetical protein